MLLSRPTDVGIGALFQRMRDAAIVADLDTSMIRRWNPAAERLFGYSASEALLLPVEALMPERLRPKHSAGFEAYRATGHGALIDRGTPIEVAALRKTGEEMRVELTLSPIEDSVFGRCVLAVIRDVSERTRAQQQAAVALLSHKALAGTDLPALMDETVRVVAKTLDIPYCGILELVPGDGGLLLLRAGVGWSEGLVGRMSVTARPDSLAEYSLGARSP
jgi:PAS domain S-box-containing protein